MKPAPFAYVRPATVADAVLRLRSDEGAAPMSGGQSLVPLLNLRLARPTTVVDLGGIAGLDSIETSGDAIHLGAMVTHDRLEHHRWPSGLTAIATAVSHIGYPAIRHRGTVGGSLAHADPSAELPAVMVGVDASIELTSPDGVRRVPADGFFEGYYTTTRGHDELVTAVSIPLHNEMSSGFAEFSRRTGDFALALAFVSRWETNAGPAARVVVGGLDVRPRRIPDLEAPVAVGDAVDGLLTPELLDEHTSPSDDIHGSGAYKLRIGAEMVRRAIAQIGGSS